jgi:hypothetical protein
MLAHPEIVTAANITSALEYFLLHSFFFSIGLLKSIDELILKVYAAFQN